SMMCFSVLTIVGKDKGDYRTGAYPDSEDFDFLPAFRAHLKVEKNMRSLRLISCLALVLLLFFCNTYAESADKIIYGNAGSRLLAESFGVFNEPWAMTFLPDGDFLGFGSLLDILIILTI
ncbi:MAG: hypothetical protein SWH54_10065, partial [Thermodesulfobacteriota bacterium]|nr:hypothetical protein [Thermodesulfobacteriota bacterium]